MEHTFLLLEQLRVWGSFYSYDSKLQYETMKQLPFFFLRGRPRLFCPLPSWCFQWMPLCFLFSGAFLTLFYAVQIRTGGAHCRAYEARGCNVNLEARRAALILWGIYWNYCLSCWWRTREGSTIFRQNCDSMLALAEVTIPNTCFHTVRKQTWRSQESYYSITIDICTSISMSVPVSLSSYICLLSVAHYFGQCPELGRQVWSRLGSPGVRGQGVRSSLEGTRLDPRFLEQSWTPGELLHQPSACDCRRPLSVPLSAGAESTWP